MLAVDIETYDPKLKDLGSGCMRCDGWILCVGTYDGQKAKVYIPGENDWDELVERLKSSEPKVFHNSMYDLGWLTCSPLYSIPINGILHDTMTRAVLIDEYKPLNLDDCCKRMKVKGKNKEETIEKWYEEHKKELGLRGGVWSNALSIWNDVEGRSKMIEYSLQDCRATFDLFYAQEPYMRPFQETYQLECDLIPVLIHMKKAGVRVDEEGLKKLREQVEEERHKIEIENEKKWGITPKIIKSPVQLRNFMNALNLHSPLLTEAGAESFNATALDKIHHPIVNDILAWKAVNSLIMKYVGEEASVARCIYNGRIYGDFNPNKREDGAGAITGRFSSNNPNLQNISAREYKHGHKTYGDELRSLFIPNEDCYMFACDYSQVEYILFMAIATGPQAEKMREMIMAGTDYHTATMHLTGITERYLAKTINYGKLYGMGFYTMLEGDNYPTWEKEGQKRGMTAEQFCRYVNDTYTERLPVIGDTVKEIQKEAKFWGYVTSIGGRRHHNPPVSYRSDGTRDDGLYKMTNYKIQGSAADTLKKALVLTYKAGVLDVAQLHLTVHDENVISVPKTRAGVEAASMLEECMNRAFLERLNVPLRASGGIGENWNAKHAEDDWQKMRLEYGLGSSKDLQRRLWAETGHKGEINTL